MGNKFHDTYVGHNNHAVTANPDDVQLGYDDIVARDADIDFQKEKNINKLVRVATTPPSVYMLISTTPTVWSVDIFGSGNPPLTPANVVPINQESDFPTQDETHIFTDDDDHAYHLGANIITDKELILGKRTTLLSSNATTLWAYTGTGDMITGVDVGFFNMDSVAFSSPNANQTFNFSDTTPNSFIRFNLVSGISLSPSTLISPKFGTFDNVNILLFNTVGGLDGLGFDDGITLANTINGITFDSVVMLSTSATFVGFDFGTAVVGQSFTSDQAVFIATTPGAIGYSGLTSSANITPGILATIGSNQFLGAITPLSGITSSDIRFEFRNSPPISDSTIDFFSSMTASQIVTIGGGNQGIFFPIAGGNWVTTKSNRWSSNTNGEFTYLFETPTDVQLMANTSLTKAGGGSDTVAMRINIDTGSGFPVPPPARTESTTENTAATNVSSSDLVTINQNDVVRIEVSNLTGVSDVEVSANARFLSINGF